MANASGYLERLYSWFKERKELPIDHKNKLHEVFAKNIRDARASRLLNALIFDKGKDLMKTPLIILEGAVLVYAFLQPLAVDEFKTRSRLPEDIAITTPRQLARPVPNTLS